ncbi:LuxR C-terminal-related transcriptional regulator [Terrihabitans soli]|nr:LuxR C-terminal-related transcriptional regulator [Terrihabitans soli]
MSINDYGASSSGHSASRKLNEIQADLVSTARLWAVDEVGAVMAHQLYEPLTALLLYLHELKRRGVGEDEGLNGAGDMIEKALSETERVCEIMEQIGRSIDKPQADNTDLALARGREAIDWVTRSSSQPKPAVPTAPPLSAQVQGLKSLTRREREVLTLITAGASNKEGGYRLGISMRTFEVHRAHIMAKLGARNAADLVRIALSEER